MTHQEAIRARKKLLKAGYTMFHNGLCRTEKSNGKTDQWGVNYDGRGTMGDPTGCPRQVWDYNDVAQIINQ
jgi:hypothetical protein